MLKFRIEDFRQDFRDNDSCLNFIKNRLYPNGIKCPVCKKITKHHKVSKRQCYVCNICGNHLYPAARTIFKKSSTPLMIWFKIINKIYEKNNNLNIKEIQKDYNLSYKTAWRIVHKVKDFLGENRSVITGKNKDNVSDTVSFKQIAYSKEPLKIVDPEETSSDIPKYENSSENNTNIFPKGDRLLVNSSKRDNNDKKWRAKKDRTARLLKLEMLLYQNPQGLSINEISHRLSVSRRTIYRDLEVLESNLGIPLWEDGTKRGVIKGFYLPPISFTMAEATNIFIAARLMQNISSLYNTSIASTFMKLNTIMPRPLQKQINNILEYIDKQPKNRRKINNFNKLIQAWLSRRKVKFLYQYVGEEKPIERIIEIYFIEPSLIGNPSIYVIAFCHFKKAICAFKSNHIIGEVAILPDTYEVPYDFNAIDYLDSAWGIISENNSDNTIEHVKIRFKKIVSHLILDLDLHPSQQVEPQSDGSVIMTVTLRDNIHFRNWVMGWGNWVEILEPETLRNEVGQFAQSIAEMYCHPSINAVSAK